MAGEEACRVVAHTVILHTNVHRALAKRLVDRAPIGAVIRIREGKRTTEQNDKMWAMISDVSRAKPDGRTHTAEAWKCLFMHACGHAVQFEQGLDGAPFPIGFRSSRLTVAQMGELMDFIDAYGARHGVQWSDPRERQDMAA